MAEHEVHDDDETKDGELIDAEREAPKSGEDAADKADTKDGADTVAKTDTGKDEKSGSGSGEGDDSAEKHKGRSDGSSRKKTSDDADDPDDFDAEEYGISMDKVQAVLNQNIDKKHMTPQMRRLAQRQEENTKRVEDTIKSTKANPRWFVPLFVTLMLIGLIWIVVYYIASTRGNVYPIPNIGNWNLLIGFGILLVGFLMTMGWH